MASATLTAALLALTLLGTPTPEEAYLSDFDNNRTIGFTDFLYFVGQYGKDTEDPSWDAKADLDKNGKVDFSDFLAFARSYGQTVPLLSGQVTDVLTGRGIQYLEISLGARTTVTDSAGRYAFESGILPAPTDVLSVAGGDSLYNYTATVADSDHVWDIQMIERFNDPNKPEIDGLERLKWFYFGSRKTPPFLLKRHLVENGPILIYFRDEDNVSQAYNDAVWEGLMEWERRTNEHLPEGRKMQIFQKVDFDPTKANLETHPDWSITPGEMSCAGGWKITYGHPNSGQFPGSEIQWYPNKLINPQYPIYGELQLKGGYDKYMKNAGAEQELKALTSHEAGRGLGFGYNSDYYDNHVMSISNSSRAPPIQVTSFEGRINAVNLKLKNNTNLRNYTK